MDFMLWSRRIPDKSLKWEIVIFDDNANSNAKKIKWIQTNTLIQNLCSYQFLWRKIYTIVSDIHST